MAANGKKGLSGLYLLLILFGLMILFGGPALVRMINIILFGQCNIAPEANKIQETIKKVCRGPVGDFEYVDYPSCPVIMSCSSCAVALRNAAFRSALGLAQAQGFAKSVTATGRSFWNIGKGAWHAPQTLTNAKNFVKDFKYALSGGEWKRMGNWWDAYQYARASGTYRNMLRSGRIVTATRNLPLWKETALKAYNTARTLLYGHSTVAGASNLIRRSPTTMVYLLVASDPNKPDIQGKVAGLADSVAAKIEPILADEEGTIVLPIGLDVHLKVLKKADNADGRLEELAKEGTATLGEANALLFDLNTHLNVLFTSVNDGVYANSQFGQGSCLQPSSTAFNSVPSNYEQVAGACTFTSTVVTQEPEDCEQVDPDCKSNCALKEPKCAKPDTFEDQNEIVGKSVSVLLRRNHAFRFLDDVQGFLSYQIDEAEKKTSDAAGKAAIAAAKADISNILDDARITAGQADDPWSFAYLAVGSIAGNITIIGQYESKAGITGGALGWYTTAIDAMNSVDELISGRWSYKKDADGNLVRDKLLADGLEQKHVSLLKIRNEAYDILLSLPASKCDKKTEEIADAVFPSGRAKITVPLCALMSSCNQDDRLLSQTGGCILGAPNLEKERVRVTMCKQDPGDDTGKKCDATHPAIGEVYFSLPAIPISPIDYGTTVKSLGVTIGLVSGLVGGEAGRALATSAFAVQNCISSNPLNTLIFCMKPASVQCVLPGGCEVCFSAKCNTRISCSSVGAANLRVEKKSEGGGIATEVTGPVKPI